MSITDSNNLRSTNYSIANLSDANRLGQDVTANIETLRQFGLGNSDSQGLQASINNSNLGYIKESLGSTFDFQNIAHQYKQISSFESTETYTGASSTTVAANTTSGQFLSGSQSQKLINVTSGLGKLQAYRDVSLNLNLFGDGVTTCSASGIIELNIYINDVSFFANDTSGGCIYIWFYTSSADRFAGTAGKRARYRIPLASLVNGWNQFRVVKNTGFSYLNGFSDSDWASLQGIYIYGTTASTSAEASFDNFYLKRNTLGISQRIAYSGSSNSDSTSGSELTVSNYTRLSGINFINPYRTYLVINNSTTGGYGLSYLITGFTNNKITVSGTLPTISSNVDWYIDKPLFFSGVEKHTIINENTSSTIKLGSVSGTTPSAKIISLNDFKPENNNRQYYLKGTFEFTTNSNNQGFCLFYVDSSNYLLAYINKNGASSTVKIDEVVSGITTNLYESSAFTISDLDSINFLVQVIGDQINIFKSNVNDFYLNLVTRYNYFNPVFINYYYNLGFYSNLEMRLLEFSAKEDFDIFKTISTKTISGTFATSATLTINDKGIHKTSVINYTLRSAPVGNIYISSISEGTIVFTSSSASETASLKLQVIN